MLASRESSVPDEPLAREGRKLHVISLRDVEIQPVEWIWKLRLPFGKLVVLDGHPGEGKSTLALDIAARASAGQPMPDGEQGYGAPFETIILSYEDDPADTLAPRVLAAGGDLGRVHFIAGVSRRDEEPYLPALPQDLDLLDRELQERPEVRLVIVDPLMAALGQGIDSHNDQSTRQVTSRLNRIAADRGVCILLVRHFPKRSGTNSVLAGGGTVGIIGQARVGLIIERSPDDPGTKVLAGSKSNVGAIGISLGFKLVPATVRGRAGELIETSKIEWLGPVEVSADELLAARQDQSSTSDHQDVTAWLNEVLSTGERIESRAVIKAGNAAGYPDRTIRSASKRLGVHIEREGKGLGHRSYWSLPTPANLPTPATPSVEARVAEVESAEASQLSLPELEVYERVERNAVMNGL
jgi:hypothetical protein